MKGKKGKPNIYIGCAKWNKADLKNFYPKGTKDELAYYATQFNSIELNATFYNNFPLETIDSWYTKTPEDFRFFPKLHQGISHWKRLKDAEQPTSVYLDHISHLEEKLGMLFLQMPDNFGPKNWEVLKDYLEVWPSGFPLALELRHTGWYDGSWDNSALYAQLEKKNITHIITDTAGRRDLLHMRLNDADGIYPLQRCQCGLRLYPSGRLDGPSETLGGSGNRKYLFLCAPKSRRSFSPFVRLSD